MIVRHVESFNYDKVQQTLVVSCASTYTPYGKESYLVLSTTSSKWSGRLFGKRGVTSYTLDEVLDMNLNTVYFNDIEYVIGNIGLFGIKWIFSRLRGDGDKLVYNKANSTLIEVGPDDTMHDIIEALRGDDL